MDRHSRAHGYSNVPSYHWNRPEIQTWCEKHHLLLFSEVEVHCILSEANPLACLFRLIQEERQETTWQRKLPIFPGVRRPNLSRQHLEGDLPEDRLPA